MLIASKIFAATRSIGRGGACAYRGLDRSSRRGLLVQERRHRTLFWRPLRHLRQRGGFDFRRGLERKTALPIPRSNCVLYVGQKSSRLLAKPLWSTGLLSKGMSGAVDSSIEYKFLMSHT